jgi:hypothetical protein
MVFIMRPNRDCRRDSSRYSVWLDKNLREVAGKHGQRGPESQLLGAAAIPEPLDICGGTRQLMLCM